MQSFVEYRVPFEIFDGSFSRASFAQEKQKDTLSLSIAQQQGKCLVVVAEPKTNKRSVEYDIRLVGDMYSNTTERDKLAPQSDQLASRIVDWDPVVVVVVVVVVL